MAMEEADLIAPRQQIPGSYLAQLHKHDPTQLSMVSKPLYPTSAWSKIRYSAPQWLISPKCSRLIAPTCAFRWTHRPLQVLYYCTDM